MAIPEFILDLRAKIGTAPLPLPGVTCVVLDETDRVLLVRRSDNGEWTLVTGSVEPGEQPAIAAVREIEEETAVVAVVERLMSVAALPLSVCPNGDQVYWMDVAFRCRAVSEEARVNDDESLEVGWFAVDQLPDIPERHAACIKEALSDRTAAIFLS